MLKKEVVLDYDCPSCHYSVHVKLHCTGKGLADGPHAAAKVNIPCPTCDTAGEIIFEMTGLVLQVNPEAKYRILEPSLN